jgi:salicylate hydroxylase
VNDHTFGELSDNVVAELKRLSVDPSRPGKPADIRLGARVRSIDCEEATITLESGETLHGDIILGCDGIKSVVRSYVLGNTAYRAVPSGLSAYRFLLDAALITSDPELAPFVLDSGISRACEGDTTFLCYPCRDLKELNCVLLVPDLVGNATENWRQEGNVEEMKNYIKGWAPKFQKLLALAESCRLWQLRDQDPLPYWTRGKAIILGDAAHPMMPRKHSAALLSIILTRHNRSRRWCVDGH